MAQKPKATTPGGVLLDARGYARQKISTCVVFGPRGDFVIAEDVLTFSAKYGADQRMIVPKSRRPDEGFDANFLWGRTSDALGVRKAPSQAAEYRLDHRAFQTFRGIHTTILDGVNDTSVKAFLLFLARWSPEQVHEVPRLQQRVGSAVAFRFRYDDEFLHEKNAARVAWLRWLAESCTPPVAPQSAQQILEAKRPPSARGSSVISPRLLAEAPSRPEAWS